ncbi:small conductance mechanosensitive channel [Mesonia hippocampi]|uniref:Small conductance mechanosensitive channel n=1 Tax=Mesonia hippocampi TaxID=1628250 RepID=A0A840EHX8_9FLAO|nr:mechanosensitive ion channel family protein [Mesonia hippocampi]MBB4118019.1 small conductance mechanosensitive channel [Mesonia hippocampi]
MQEAKLSLERYIEKLWATTSDWVEDFAGFLPSLIVAIIILTAFIFLAKYIAKLTLRILLKRDLQQSVRNIISRIIKFIVITIGIFIALSVLHLDKFLTTLLATAGVGSLAIGLALQGTLNNTFSGIVLSFIPEVQLRDWIETNGYSGEVLEVNLRNIVIKEADNNFVVIPNSKIAEGTFKNYSRTKRTRIMLNCGVGYESNLDFVEELTLTTIRNNFKTRRGEYIDFAYTEFGDSAINYVVRFWVNAVNKSDELMAKHQAIKAIRKAYNEHDINIPFPIRTLDFDKNKFRAETIQVEHKNN